VSSKNANADAMSRLPVGIAEPGEDNEVFFCSFLEEMPVEAKKIHEVTKVDPVLSQVLKYTYQTQLVRHYFNHKEHLTVEQGCILLGYRVNVPTKFMIDYSESCIVTTQEYAR